MKDERLRIGATAVDCVSMEQALGIFEGFLEDASGRCAMIATPNCEIAMAAEKDPALRAAIEGAELVIPDGTGFFFASKKLGRPLPERLAGIEFCYGAMQLCASKGSRVYLLGGKPGSGGGPCVAELAAKRLMQQIPGLEVCGAEHGYFSADEEAKAAERVRLSGADFLVAGLGSPKQELFLSKHLDSFGCRACIGVGGSLDVWSGRLKRAPGWMTRCGLEWLFRLAQEPRRIKRIARIPLFLLRIMK